MTLTAVPPQIGPKTKDGAKPSVLVLNKLVGLVVARHHSHRRHYHVQIGRASCRERVSSPV